MVQWDHDACVSDPVSGNVWEDVLRQVAVWSYRVDTHAERLERVCKRWKHFWAVAEGVFRIDVRLGRVPANLKPHEFVRRRERLREAWLLRKFGVGVCGDAPRAPVVRLEGFLANHA